MTRIDFHSNVLDRWAYICRLVRKIYLHQARVVIVGNQVELARLDSLLWSFSQIDFIPHCYANSSLAEQTPILLTTELESLPHYQILLNLSEQPPSLFARFERLLEIVGMEENERLNARERYRFYRDRGYPLQNFDQKGRV